MSIEDFVQRNKSNAKSISPGSDILYWIGRRPLRNNTSIVRTLVVFYRLRKAKRNKKDDDPESAIDVDADYQGYAFYVNHPDPASCMAWLERAYSRRWSQENWFKKRSANCHDGRAHLADRRMFIFVIGCIVLAVYDLLRAIKYPDLDVVAVSRHYTVPSFVSGLLKALSR